MSIDAKFFKDLGASSKFLAAVPSNDPHLLGTTIQT